MIEAAAAIALRDGLDKVTAKRVAAVLGVRPGLVDHYFSADQLVAAAFAHAASAERNEVFDEAESVPDPVAGLKRLMAAWLEPDHDEFSLLWLDAWQASRARPALHAAVSEQMVVWQQRVADLIAAGVADGVFRNDDPLGAATRLMAVVDGLSVHAAMGSPVDYAVVRQLVIDSTERELGLRRGELEPRT